MEHRTLRYFLTIAREENMTNAANILHVSQSALSRQMTDLEAELGRKLFIRTNRKTMLTEDGMRLRQRAEEIISLVEKTEMEFKASDETISGQIAIGAGETRTFSLIARAMKQTQSRFPHIHFTVYSANAVDVTERLEHGTLDFGLLFEPVNKEHYQYLARQRGVKPLDGDGHLILYPSSGCETYKMAYNSASVIAALSTVTTAYTQYLEQQQPTDTTAIAWLKALSGRIPPLPLRTIDGHTCIAPAVVWARIQNVETPQLYPVFPWRGYGMGRPNLDIARNTYLNDPHALSMRTSKGWKQDNIWAACLGITDDARQLTIEKFADGPYRFPAFWDPGYDWAPDCNRGGSAMIGLHEMLLQEDATGQLLLFPTWPKGWDARFRLHATGGRVVEAEIREGKVTTIQQ